MIADRNAFLAGPKRRYGAFQLPVSGLMVRFQSLTEREQAEHEREQWTLDDDGKLQRDDDVFWSDRARLIVRCLVDEEGNRILSEADIEQVQQLDGADLRALYGELRRHCGIEGDPAELKKNSLNGSARSLESASPTGSPETAV